MSEESDRALAAAKKALRRQERQNLQAQTHETVENQTGFRRIFGALHRLQKIPLLGWAGRLLRLVARLYARLFQRLAYAGTPRRLAPGRALVVGLLMLASAIMIPWFAVRNVIPFTAKLTYDVAMLASSRQDTFIFGDPDLLDEANLVYEVQACSNANVCDAQSARVFRIRQSSLLNIISWVRNGHGYDAANISAAFYAERNECDITYYGFRVRGFGFYPFITNATCRAL